MKRPILAGFVLGCVLFASAVAYFALHAYRMSGGVRAYEASFGDVLGRSPEDVIRAHGTPASVQRAPDGTIGAIFYKNVRLGTYVMISFSDGKASAVSSSGQ